MHLYVHAFITVAKLVWLPVSLYEHWMGALHQVVSGSFKSCDLCLTVPCLYRETICIAVMKGCGYYIYIYTVAEAANKMTHPTFNGQPIEPRKGEPSRKQDLHLIFGQTIRCNSWQPMRKQLLQLRGQVSISSNQSDTLSAKSCHTNTLDKHGTQLADLLCD